MMRANQFPGGVGTRRASWLEATLVSVPGVIFCSLTLYLALYLTLANYASLEYPEYGFDAGSMGPLEYFILLLLVPISSWAVPKSIDRASSLFLIFVYSFILIPLQVMALASERAAEGTYIILVLVVHISFVACCRMINSIGPNEQTQEPKREPSKWLVPFLVVTWLIFTILLYLLYGDIMTFTSLDQIYGQREIGKARNLYEGYLQTYYQFVVSPALCAFGCARKKYSILALGIAGAMVSYSITAEKAGFIYPAFIIALFFMVRARGKIYTTTSAIMMALSVVLFASVATWKFSEIGNFIVWYLGARTLLIPGTTITVYQDYFSRWDYTYFSHIRGLDLFISVPEFFENHKRWPSIGHLVGEDHLNIDRLQYNANFIASDGVASLGTFGCIIAFTLLYFVLVAMDRVTKGIEPKLLYPLLLPSALYLTNGSVFTYFASYGGFFWILVFATCFAQASKLVNRPVIYGNFNHGLNSRDINRGIR
jgi:hypothetical protein